MEAQVIIDGPTDALLAHESPARAVPEVQSILAGNPHGFPSDALAVSAAQRERVQRVSDAVMPRLHLHGHMHVYGDVEHADGRRVISLDRDTFAGNAGVLDLESLPFEPFPDLFIRGRW